MGKRKLQGDDIFFRKHILKTNTDYSYIGKLMKINSDKGSNGLITLLVLDKRRY